MLENPLGRPCKEIRTRKDVQGTDISVRSLLVNQITRLSLLSGLAGRVLRL